LKDNNLKELTNIIDNTYLLSSYKFKANIIHSYNKNIESITGIHTKSSSKDTYTMENRVTSLKGEYKVGLKCHSGTGTQKWADELKNGKEYTINLKIYAGNHPYINVTEFQLKNYQTFNMKDIKVENINENLRKYIIIYDDNKECEYIVDTKLQLLRSCKHQIGKYELDFEYN
jgi:hypothetical protein